MENFRLFQLSQQMRELPEFARLQKLIRFSNSLRIFETNYRELDRLLWFICDSVAGEQLFQVENVSAWEQAIEEVIRFLQNFIASASSLVDHSRTLYFRMYEPTRSFREYPDEVKRRLEENQAVQFVHGLRNYCLHYRTPDIGTTMTFIDIQNDRVERRVTLHKSDLQDFEWTATAKQFLDGAPQFIDIRGVLASYHSQIEDFYNWFAERIQVLHASDYATVSSWYEILLSGQKERHLVALELRLKAYEAGVGSPLDVLDPFMTPLDSVELYPLLRDPEKWVIAAARKVSQYVPLPCDVVPRLVAAIKRPREQNLNP